MGLGRLNPGSGCRPDPCNECDVCDCSLVYRDCSLRWNCFGSTRGRLLHNGIVISNAKASVIYAPDPGDYVLEKFCDGVWSVVGSVSITQSQQDACRANQPRSCCEILTGDGPEWAQASSGFIAGIQGISSWANGTWMKTLSCAPANFCPIGTDNFCTMFAQGGGTYYHPGSENPLPSTTPAVIYNETVGDYNLVIYGANVTIFGGPKYQQHGGANTNFITFQYEVITQAIVYQLNQNTGFWEVAVLLPRFAATNLHGAGHVVQRCTTSAFFNYFDNRNDVLPANFFAGVLPSQDVPNNLPSQIYFGID